MAGYISGSSENWDLLLGEHGVPLQVSLGTSWFPKTRLWLGGTPSSLGSVSGSGLSRAWVVFEPSPLPATGRV